jgi:hypothetical protein
VRIKLIGSGHGYPDRSERVKNPHRTAVGFHHPFRFAKDPEVRSREAHLAVPNRRQPGQETSSAEERQSNWHLIAVRQLHNHIGNLARIALQNVLPYLAAY